VTNCINSFVWEDDSAEVAVMKNEDPEWHITKQRGGFMGSRLIKAQHDERVIIADVQKEPY
jgi:hypothetical protein